MAYNYQEMKPKLFTEENQKLFLAIRDMTQKFLRRGGAVKLGSIMDEQLGSSWEMTACVDRLIELGEIKEVHYGDCFAQDRIFVKVKK